MTMARGSYGLVLFWKGSTGNQGYINVNFKSCDGDTWERYSLVLFWKWSIGNRVLLWNVCSKQVQNKLRISAQIQVMGLILNVYFVGRIVFSTFLIYKMSVALATGKETI